MSEHYKKSDGSIYTINYDESNNEEKNRTNSDYAQDEDFDEYSFKDIQDKNASDKIVSTEKNKSNKYENFKIAARQILQILVATILLVAAMIGFSVAVSFVNKDSNVQDLKSYDGLIWPVVMQDPEPFNENISPEPNMMVRASVWDAVSARKKDDNVVNNGPTLILSEDEVQMSSRKLFGKEIDLENPDLKDAYFYQFDKDAKIFSISPISADQNFVPHTVNAKPNGDETILNVGYVVPQNQFNSQMNQVTENKVEKFAEYVLKDNPLLEGKYIVAVK